MEKPSVILTNRKRDVNIIKPDNLALLFKSFVWGGKPFLSLGACAFFHLDARLPNRLMLDQDMWPVIQDALGKGEVFDFAHPKGRGEFLIYGSCFAARPVPALEVAVRIGSLSKKLAVFGNRWWQAGGIPGAPESFQCIPITFDYAYGGPVYPPNPLGKGHEADATGRQPLPNIQDPARLMGSPKETPPVAGLAAYPLSWPQRTRYLGKFDGDWLVESWPHFPADTNLEFFNTAPEDQRLDGFFKGDEAIEILHMHPRQERIISVLPALRARLFVWQSEGGKEVFKEVPARAETVWLFPDRECGIVLYRGAVAVADEEFEDIIHVLAAWEALGEPAHSVAEYQAALEKRLAPPPPPEEPAAPPPPEEPALPVPPPAGDGGTISPVLAGLAVEAEALMAAAVAEMKKFGIDPEAAMKKFMPPHPESKPASLDDLMAMTTRLQEETKATLARFGLDETAAQKLLEPKPAAPPASPEEIIGNLRKAGIANPEIEAQINAAHKMGQEALAALKELEQGKERAADFEQAAAAETAPPPRTAALTVEEVLSRRQGGESLRGLDLTGLDFTGCDLTGADFTGAVMAKTIFRKANLKGTVFRETILTEVDFTEATMEGAVLAGANATQGTFARAVLSGADLSRGDFTGADFQDGSAQGAVLSGAVFEKALFIGFKGEKVQAVQAVFAGADLTEADFNYADLTNGDLSNTNLSFAAFGGAKADGLRLYGAKGEATVFGGAYLAGSRADKDTVLENLRLNHANLAGSNWEGARLSRAQMVETILDGADFGRCDLSGAATFRVSAKGTNFMKTNFHEANLTGINLLQGSLRKARLTRTDLQFSNLYGVDLYKAKLGKTNLTDTNLKNTLLTLKVDI